MEKEYVTLNSGSKTAARSSKNTKAAERPDIQNPTSEDLHSKQKEREVQGLACAR